MKAMSLSGAHTNIRALAEYEQCLKACLLNRRWDVVDESREIEVDDAEATYVRWLAICNQGNTVKSLSLRQLLAISTIGTTRRCLKRAGA